MGKGKEGVGRGKGRAGRQGERRGGERRERRGREARAEEGGKGRGGRGRHVCVPINKIITTTPLIASIILGYERMLGIVVQSNPLGT